jgi:hypothetical protein
MFCHLKPWQSWQVIIFYSYECQRIKTKNPFDEILSLSFDWKLPKVNSNALDKGQFCKYSYNKNTFDGRKLRG